MDESEIRGIRRGLKKENKRERGNFRMKENGKRENNFVGGI